MSGRNLFTTIFVFACVLICRGDVCNTYDGNGLCIADCINGRVLYSAGCVQPTMSERTCRHPNPRSLGVLCDYYRCDCPYPQVLDEATNKCMNIDQCPKQTSKKSSRYDKM